MNCTWWFEPNTATGRGREPCVLAAEHEGLHVRPPAMALARPLPEGFEWCEACAAAKELGHGETCAREPHFPKNPPLPRSEP